MKKVTIILALLSAIIGCTVTKEPDSRKYFSPLKKGDYVVVIGGEKYMGQIYQVHSDFKGKDWFGNECTVFVNKPGDTMGFMGISLEDVYPCDSLGKMRERK